MLPGLWAPQKSVSLLLYGVLAGEVEFVRLRVYVQGFCRSTPSRHLDAPCDCACGGCVVRAHVCMFLVRRRSGLHVHACGRFVLSCCPLVRLLSCRLVLSASCFFGFFLSLSCVGGGCWCSFLFCLVSVSVFSSSVSFVCSVNFLILCSSGCLLAV